MPRVPTVRWHATTNAWRSDVGPHGKNGRRQPEYFREIPNTPKGRREAEAKLAAYLEDRDRREAAAEDAIVNPPVWLVVEMYLEHSEKKSKPRTTASHAERLSFWERRAPGATPDADGDLRDVRQARQLQAADLRRTIKAMNADGLSAHYVAGIVASIKACWAWAARDEEDRVPRKLIPEDVFRDVKGPAIPPAPERYMPPDRAEALIRFIEAKAAEARGLTGEFERMAALLYRCLYESGARPSELCRATWRDFDPDMGVIVLRKHKTDAKKSKPRRVPLTADLVRAIVALRDRDGKHPENLFTHRRGRKATERGETDARAGVPWKVGPLGQKFRKLRAQAAKAGLDVRVRDGMGQVPDELPECTLYDFRRSFSTDSDEAGFSDDRTADAMGNSAAMVNRTYKTRHARRAVQVAEAVAEGRRAKPEGDPAP